ncbi:MAG: hypothetical protein P8X70_00645 [Nanoarchaeota archaeon]
MIETSKLTAERIKEYLQEGKRFDGRGLDEFRDIGIETGVSKNAEGRSGCRRYCRSSCQMDGYSRKQDARK